MARGLETSRREVSLATIHPAGYYREECRNTGLLASSTVEKWQLLVGNRKTVLPRYAYGDGIRKIDLCAALLVIVRPLLQQARINRAWLPSEIFPKYVSVAEKEKTIANRLRRATKRGKFSRAVWVFDVVLNSRQQEIPKRNLSQIYEIFSVLCSILRLRQTTLSF